MSTARTFEFELSDDASPTELVTRARAKARQAGIDMEGDETGGAFTGTAEGRYEVHGRSVRIEVVKKPSFVPWSLVESGLRRAFA